MSLYQTGTIEEFLFGCEDVDDLKQRILPLLQDQRAVWTGKISQIMESRQLTCKQMAQLCRVSEPAVRKWMRGALPQSRDMYIRIGFAAGYDLDQMNSFLRRFGRCPQLYVKSLEDSVCMFVLQSDCLEHSYETYQQFLEIVKKELQGTNASEGQAYSTVQMAEDFSGVLSAQEMIAFAQSNVRSFRQSYHRLYGYVKAYLQINLSNDLLNLGDRSSSFNAMATEAGWSSSLRHVVSEIKKQCWFPLRHKVISLGLHLNMDTDAINEMLSLAHMEPLYVKNPVEAAIVWAIEEARLCSEDDAIVQDGSSELCEFVKDILVQLGLAEEANYLIDDL